jgi:hypothetical protein
MVSRYPLNTQKIINLEPRYSFFFVRDSRGIQLEYYILQYSYPSVKSVSIANFGGAGINITPLTDREYTRGTFSHPRYINQAAQPLTFRYTELPIKKV